MTDYSKVVTDPKFLYSRDDFKNQVMKKLLNDDTEECNICLGEFESYNDKKALSCTCNAVYHFQCILQWVNQNRNCPSCRKNSTDANITDLFNRTVSVKLYDGLYEYAKKLIGEDKATLNWVQFISNWIGYRKNPRQFRSSGVVNPYHFISLTKFDPEVDINNRYPNKLVMNDFKSPLISSLTVGKDLGLVEWDKFLSDFDKCTEGIFTNFGFDWWDSSCIAGGSIAKILDPRITEYPESMDIDIFVYGTTDVERNETVEEILHWFGNNFKKQGVYFAVRNSVVYIYITGIKRQFQLICSTYVSIDDVLSQFDLDHISVAYNGKEIVSTPEYIFAVKHRVSSFKWKKDIHINRLIKTIKCGYKLLLTKNYENVVNIVKPKNTQLYFPEESSTPEEIVEDISDVTNVPVTNITTKATKCRMLVNSNEVMQRGGGYFDNSYLINDITFPSLGKNIQITHKYSHVYSGYRFFPNITQLKDIIFEVPIMSIKDSTYHHDSKKYIFNYEISNASSMTNCVNYLIDTIRSKWIAEDSETKDIYLNFTNGHKNKNRPFQLEVYKNFIPLKVYVNNHLIDGKYESIQSLNSENGISGQALIKLKEVFFSRNKEVPGYVSFVLAEFRYTTATPAPKMPKPSTSGPSTSKN